MAILVVPLTPGGLALALVNSLEELDRRAGPFGLYAIDEFDAGPAPVKPGHNQWRLALRPTLQALGANVVVREPSDRGPAEFAHPDLGLSQLWFKRISRLKVRRFGSRHRIDPRVDYPSRWQRLRMPDLLNEIAHPKRAWGRPGASIALLVAFAPEPVPFEAERQELAKIARSLETMDRTWADRYERDFYVRVTAWVRRAAA